MAYKKRTELEHIQKYYNFLKELKSEISRDQGDFKMTELIKVHGMSASVPTIMKKGGLYEVKGRGSRASYKWISHEPSPEMAKELLRRVRKYSKETAQNSKAQKQGEPTKVIQVEESPLNGSSKPEKKPSIADKQERTKEKYHNAEKVPAKELKNPAKEERIVVKKSILWGLYKYEKVVK